MKKLLTIILVALIVLLSMTSCGGQFTPKDFHNTVKTGGEIESKYMAMGAYEVAHYEEAAFHGFGKYQIYYPAELARSSKIYPVIVFSNGSGCAASKYFHLLEHTASWGFIAIGTEEEFDWNGFASEMCLRHLIRLNEVSEVNDKPNIFKGKIDLDNVGITGHSQGGVGVFNAITVQEHSYMYKAAVSLSPTNIELAAAIEWAYDATKISTPIMLLSGAGGGDDWVVTGEQLKDIFDLIDSDKIMMRRVDTDHGQMLYSGEGYVIAFFMYHLQGDAEAGKAFFGDEAEILNNPLWQDVNKSE